MDKIVHVGKTRHSGNLFCRICYEDNRLSITGVEGPKHNGDCLGSCGQIVMSDWEIAEYSDGWNSDLVEKFRQVWNEWHLNDMQSGSPAQCEWIKSNRLDYGYPKSYYEVYRDALKEVGLNPDLNYLHNGKPYSFGSAWLKKEVPDEVISFLENLPASNITPAWV